MQPNSKKWLCHFFDSLKSRGICRGILLYVLFQILVVQPVEVLVVAEHMGEGVDLDEAVEALVPHELPQLDVLPGVAHAVQLGLGLLGVAADDLVDGGALVDLVDDEPLDL